MKSAKVRSMLGSNSVFNKKPLAVEPAVDDAPGETELVMLPLRLPKATRTQLRKMAVDMDTTQRNLIREALNDLFKKYGKPPIA